MEQGSMQKGHPNSTIIFQLPQAEDPDASEAGKPGRLVNQNVAPPALTRPFGLPAPLPAANSGHATSSAASNLFGLPRPAPLERSTPLGAINTNRPSGVPVSESGSGTGGLLGGLAGLDQPPGGSARQSFGLQAEREGSDPPWHSSQAGAPNNSSR